MSRPTLGILLAAWRTARTIFRGIAPQRARIRTSRPMASMEAAGAIPAPFLRNATRARQ